MKKSKQYGFNCISSTILGLLLWLLPVCLHAQFIRINLDIAPKTTTAQVQPLELRLQPDFNTGLQNLAGTLVIALTGAENLQIQVSLRHSDSLRNQTGHTLPLTTSLAYRNDGQSLPPGATSAPLSGRPVSLQASFPLSNSGLLIQHITPRPDVLRAYLFVSASTGLPQYANTTYVGNIYLQIEYN